MGNWSRRMNLIITAPVFPSIDKFDKVDHWGYYNGANNNYNLIPEHFMEFGSGCGIYFEGADREPNEDFGKSAILREIGYPTGGKTEFLYGAHEYSYIGGSKVEDQQQYETTPMSTSAEATGDTNQPWQYVLGEEAFGVTANSSMLSLAIDFSTWVPGPGGQNFLPQVTIECTNGPAYSHTWISEVAPANQSYAHNTTVLDNLCLEPGDYKVTCRAMATNFGLPFGPIRADHVLATLDWGESDLSAPVLSKKAGGVRIKEIRVDDGVSGSPKVRQFGYSMTDSSGYSSGVIMGETIYSYEGSGLVAYEVPPSQGGPYCTLYYCDFTQFVGFSKIMIGDTDGSHIGYRNVTELHGVGGSNGGIRYEYLSPYENPDLVNNEKPFAPPTSNSFKTGLLKKTTVEDVSGNAVRETSYEYEYNQLDIPSAKASYGRIPPVRTNIGDYCTLNLEQWYSQHPFSDKFAWWFAPLRMGNVQVKQRVETDYFGSGDVTKTTDYIYDQNLQYLKSQSFANSDSKVHETKYYYPNDVNWPMGGEEQGAIDCMVENHIVGIPIRTEYRVDGALVKGNWSEYKLFQTGPNCSDIQAMPSKLYSYKEGWHEEATVNSYTSDGYPTEVVRRGWSPEEYTWQDGLLIQKKFDVWIWQWDWYFGTHRQLKKYTDIDGQAVEYKYDGLVRLSETLARNGIIKTTHGYGYGAPKQWQGGNFSGTVVGFTDGSFETQNTISYFDGLGRPLDTWRMGYGPGMENIVAEKIWYDGHGRAGKNVYMPDIQGGLTYTEYTYEPSPLNRVEEETYPDGNSVTTAYGNSGNYYKVTVTDENGNPTTSISDIISRNTQTIDAYGNATAYGYDDKDNLKMVTNPEGETYTYYYDDRNRMVNKTVPGQEGCQEFYYNERDLLTATLDPNLREQGKILGNTYDIYGRIEKTGFGIMDNGTPVGCSLSPTIITGFTVAEVLIENAYDAQGNGECTSNYSPIGRLASTSAATLLPDGGIGGLLETSFCYDDYGRAQVTKSDHLTGDDTYISGYDGADNLTLMIRHHTHSGGYLHTVQNNFFDHGGRLEGYLLNGGSPYFDYLSVPGTDLSFSGANVTLNYTTKDQLLTKNLDGLATLTHRYNDRGWLTHINNMPFPPGELTDAACIDPTPGPVPPDDEKSKCAECPEGELTLQQILALRFQTGLSIDCYIGCECTAACNEEEEEDCDSTLITGGGGITNTVEGLDLPTMLFQIEDCDDEQSIVPQQELPYVEKTYTVLQRIPVQSESQMFRVEVNGVESVTDLAGLFALTNGETEFDITAGGEGTACPPACSPDPPECTCEEAEAQVLSLANIPLVTNASGLAPTTLKMVRLCDGTEIYLFAQELAHLQGPYTTLQIIDITSDVQEVYIGDPSSPFKMTLQGYLNIRTLYSPDNVNLYYPCEENKCANVDQIFPAKSIGSSTLFSNYFGNGPYLDMTTLGNNPNNSLNDDEVVWHPFVWWYQLQDNYEAEWDVGVTIPFGATLVSSSAHIQLSLPCSTNVKLALFVDDEVITVNGGQEYIDLWSEYPGCQNPILTEIDFYPDQQLTAEQLAKLKVGIAKTQLSFNTEIDVVYVKVTYTLPCDPCQTNPLECTPEQIVAQNLALNQIQQAASGLNAEEIPIPTNLYRILLCDGSEVYLLHHELEMLPQPYTILQTIAVNGIDDKFNGGPDKSTPPPPQTVPAPRTDLFALQLDYYKAKNQSNLFQQNGLAGVSKGYKNGNIARMTWEVVGRDRQLYGYEYDKLDRLLNAPYAEMDEAGAMYNYGRYKAWGFAYDKIGNLQHLNRAGMTGGCDPNSEGGLMEFGQIDGLSYSYGNSRLSDVMDNSGSDMGFVANGGTQQAYGYDKNGNTVFSQNKDLNTLYNHLNLPRQATTPKGVVKWTYDATGRLLQKVSECGADQDCFTVTYADGIEHQNGTEVVDGEVEFRVGHFVAFADGRASYHGDTENEGEADSSRWQTEYHCSDHLGNIRLIFADRNLDGYIQALEGEPSYNPGETLPEGYTEIQEEKHYYPFGMELDGPWRTPQGFFGDDFHGYNGKELVSDVGIDWMPYGARFYDAQLGRFTGVDPIADRFAWVSTYNYAENSPIANIDLHGLQASYYSNQLDKRFGSSEYRNSSAGQRQDQRNGEAKTVSSGLAVAIMTVLPGPEDAVLAGFALTKLGSAAARLGGKAVDFVSGIIKKGGDEAISGTGKTVDDLAELKIPEGQQKNLKGGSGDHEGEFSVSDWSGYPDNVPKPKGPFKLLEGDEYQNARKAANNRNRQLHRADKDTYSGHDIHEIHPVKFNGSPTGLSNKIPLKRNEHSPVTTFWNRLKRAVKNR